MDKKFEDIWNEAEIVAAKLDDQNVDDIIQQLHSRIDILKNCVNLPKDQAVNIGEILFSIAHITHITEKKTNKSVNVAAAMELATENRKSDLK